MIETRIETVIGPGRAPAAELAGRILLGAGLRVLGRMSREADAAGPRPGGIPPGRFCELCKAEVAGMLRDLEGGDPALAAAVPGLLAASGW